MQRAPKLSPSSYRALLELHARSRDALQLASGHSLTALQHDRMLQTAIRQQVRSMLAAAEKIQDSKSHALHGIDAELALLRADTSDWETLPPAIQRINSHVAALVQNIKPPRWTPLGVRQRLRRLFGKNRGST